MKTNEIFSNSPQQLNQEQRIRFYDQGYLVFPELIGDEWLTPLRRALSDIVEQSRSQTESTQVIDLEPDHSVENPRLRRVAYVDDIAPVFWELCSESVLPEIAADLLGPNVKFRELMMNFKWADGGAEVKWHQDIVFYPHTHAGTLQFLLLLNGVTSDQGPLQIIPGSHKGDIFEHYDANGHWTGAISEHDLASVALDMAVSIEGPPGTVSVHHSRTIHGSAQNLSSLSRPAFVVTYSAADAMPYTAPSYKSSHYNTIVRGKQPRFAHHEDMIMPLPPDWSEGYTSIFEHQQKPNDGN